MEDEELTREEWIHYQCPDIEEECDQMFAAGLQWTLEEEAKDAQEHALEYKRERDALNIQIDELKKAHAMELTRMKAAYQAEMATLRGERNRLAHCPGTRPVDEIADSAPLVTIAELVNLVKERFTKLGAMEVSTLLFHLAGEKGVMTDEVFKMIDGIMPTVINREHQTINIHEPKQVNINPQKVENKYNE